MHGGARALAGCMLLPLELAYRALRTLGAGALLELVARSDGARVVTQMCFADGVLGVPRHPRRRPRVQARQGARRARRAAPAVWCARARRRRRATRGALAPPPTAVVGAFHVARLAMHAESKCAFAHNGAAI